MRTINLCFFNSEIVHPGKDLFPSDIENDPWVIYHGTSGFNAEGIEQQGFLWHDENSQRSDIEKLVGIFETMQWCGTDLSSFNVLKNYSLMHDFGEHTASSIYFAETSKRALLYATRDFAGGEKMRAIRNSIEQLKRYLDSPDIRQEHFIEMRNEYDYLVGVNSINANSSRPVDIDLDWLANELFSLSGLHSRSIASYERHDYGVIYAVKLTDADLGMFEHHSSMGFKAHGTVLPDKIIGKMIIPDEYCHRENGRSFDELCKLNSFETGPYAVLSRANCKA